MSLDISRDNFSEEILDCDLTWLDIKIIPLDFELLLWVYDLSLFVWALIEWQKSVFSKMIQGLFSMDG